MSYAAHCVDVPVDGDHRDEIAEAIALVQTPRMSTRLLDADDVIAAASRAEAALDPMWSLTAREGATVHLTGDTPSDGWASRRFTPEATQVILRRDAKRWRLTRVERAFRRATRLTPPTTEPDLDRWGLKVLGD